MRKSEINSVEIARLAGVSRSTVSRVINNYRNVPPETKEKVMKVIEQYHYVPHASAQVLAGKKTRTLGLFFINSGSISRDILANMLIVSVIENAAELGYHVLSNIIRSKEDLDSIRVVKEIFYQRRIDGGIFIGSDYQESFIEELIEEGFVVGVLDYELTGKNEPNRVVVNFNNEQGMRLAVEHLIGLGHREIGIVVGDMKRHSSPVKYETFKKVMNQHNLPVNENWVLSLQPGMKGQQAGYQRMTELIREQRKLPTAFVTVNDSVAFGIIAALQEQGIAVPEEVSVIGFDDHALSERFQPPLTTIKVDFTEMLKKLTHRVVEVIEAKSDEEPSSQVVVEPQLIIRGSVTGM